MDATIMAYMGYILHVGLGSYRENGKKMENYYNIRRYKISFMYWGGELKSPLSR